LQSVGFDVKAFSSAEEFFKGLDLSQRGCIVLDIRVPGLTGGDLQKKLASERIRIPVIAISAFDDGETRERARELGATAFFRKPVDGQALIDAIDWAVGIVKDRPGASGS
jgi:FixJ family two-component response regulator